MNSEDARKLSAGLTQLSGTLQAIASTAAALVAAKEQAERERDSMARRLGVRHQAQVEAVRLIQYALHLRMHGENAPGGTETWAQFDRDAEAFLRAIEGPDGGYPPVRVPENTGKHPGESDETGTDEDTVILPFETSPWKMIELPDPVRVEAGKHYEVGIDDNGRPYVTEISSGGATFPEGGTITSVGIHESGGVYGHGHGPDE